MTAIVAVATVLISLGGFLDFLLGEPGNRKIRDYLVDFYIRIEEGDWSLLYILPAVLLLKFIQTILSNRLFSIRFMIRAMILSVCVTALMLLSYMCVVYLQAVWHQTAGCRAPPLSLALEVPIYLHDVLFKAFIVNATFDVITWSATTWGLRIIRATQNKYIAFGTVLVFGLLAIVILCILRSVYLPISLAIGVRDFGINFGIHDYLQFFAVNFFESLQEVFYLGTFIEVECYMPPNPPFQISLIFLTQYAALEALLPVVLFVVTCLLGSFAYLTRQVTRDPLALITERLAASKNVCMTIASLLSGLVAIIKVLFGSAR